MHRLLSGLLVCGVIAATVLLYSSADGQTSSKGSKKSGSKKPVANTAGLDGRAERLQTTFVKDAEDLASEYFDAGQLEKAKLLLKSAITLMPDSQGLKKKLDAVEEEMLSSNEVTAELDTSASWKPTKVLVTEGKPVRIQVVGQGQAAPSYRFSISETVGPAGFPTTDSNNQDMVGGMPCGALLGAILKSDNKPGRPFLIGEKLEFTPKDSGLLFLRINAPAGNKNTGKLKLSVSGAVLVP
ncbi:MAG: hypothetical protein HZA46_04650 [Planctomycetales bacterium]|nr:hypothetical protein [Planctomycetales bacterium]